VSAACLRCGGEGATIATTSQALTAATPYDVMPGVNTALDYADKCGLAGDYDLPALGTTGAPIRGTIAATDVGRLVSNGWKLIQSFNSNVTDVAVTETY